MAIDVGDSCIDRGSSHGEGTRVNLGNPANATGTIDTVCVYAMVGNDIAHVEYASFVHEGANVLSTNGDTNGSELTASEETTHTAPGDFTAFNISLGEYIGIHWWGGGRIEKDNVGAGTWEAAGNQIPADSVEFGLNADETLSLYATGTEVGAGVVPTGGLYGSLIGPFGGPMGPMGGRL